MFKRLSFLIILFVLLSPAFSQTTSVTGTVTDSDGITWTSAKWSVSWISNGLQTNPCVYQLSGHSLCSSFWKSYLNQNGTSDATTGAFSVTLLDNTQIAPSGSKWVFTIQSNTVAPATQYDPLTISGTSEDLSSYLSINSIVPRFPALGPQSFGYSDNEISTVPNPGAYYYNVTNQTTRQWSGPPTNVWQNLTSSSWNGGNVSNAIGAPGLTISGNAAINGQISASNITYKTPSLYGAKSDGKEVFDAVTTANSCTITSASGAFSNAIVGMPIVIVGAGDPAWSGNGQAFTQTIASINAGGTSITVNQDSTGHCPYQSLNPSPYTVFGTDDTIAIQDCITNATLKGSRCTLQQGTISLFTKTLQFTGSTIAKTPGGILDGAGKLIFIPILPLSFPTTVGTGNEVSMWFNASEITSTCEQITSGTIPLSSTSFTVANSSEYSGMISGDWIVISFEPVTGISSLNDWYPFSSGSGTTVTLGHPTRITFDDHSVPYLSNCQGLAFFGLSQYSVPTNIVLKDFTLIIPNVQDGTNHITAMSSQFTRGLTRQNLTVKNAGERAFASNFDYNDIAINDHFSESFRSEYTNSVDDFLAYDIWDNSPDLITGGLPFGNQTGGPSLSYGFGWGTVSHLKIQNPNNAAAIAAYSGMHDSHIEDISIDYNISTANPTAGIISTGGNNNTFSHITCSGTSASVGATCLLIEQDVETPSGGSAICYSQNNNYWDNINASGYNNDILNTQCPGDVNTSVGSKIDQTTGNLIFSTGIQSLSNGYFGNTTTPSLNPVQITGSDTGGLQIPLLSTTVEDSFGSSFSSGDYFSCSNCLQTTLNVDDWSQPYSSVGSASIQIGYINGFNLYFIPSGTSHNTFATFMGSSKFKVDNSGNLIFPGNLQFGGGSQISTSSDIPQVLASPSGGGISCWKTITGTPYVLGTCSTTPSGTPPTCTCN